MRKRIKQMVMMMAMLLFCIASWAQQDILVTITPVQQVLPPQVSFYYSNPGSYFNITLTNTGSSEQVVYLDLNITQISPNSNNSVIIPPDYQPQKGITIPANGTHILNMIEKKNLYKHVPQRAIKATAVVTKGVDGTSTTLLSEGMYQVQISAYKWDRSLIKPLKVSSETAGIANFNVCYKAQAPAFLTPFDGTDELFGYRIAELSSLNPQLTWKAPIVTCNPAAAQFTYDVKIVELIIEANQNPNDAITKNPIFYEAKSLLAPMCLIPHERVTKMNPKAIYVVQVTAKDATGGRKDLRYTMIENDGKSDLKLFSLKSPNSNE